MKKDDTLPLSNLEQLEISSKKDESELNVLQNLEESFIQDKTSLMLSKLNMGNLWQWILCLCTIDFDLDHGHVLECSYPPLVFNDSEKKNIAFSCFPDSNSSEHVGDSIFSFRMRNTECSKECYVDHKSPNLQKLNSQDWHQETNLGLQINSDGYLYGFVYFRQCRQVSRKRGYFQKSLVLLSPHPWFGLFSQIVRILGPMLMDCIQNQSNQTNQNTNEPLGYIPLFETACFNIASWPPPPSYLLGEFGYSPVKMTLPFLGSALHTMISPAPHVPQYDMKSRSNQEMMGSKMGLYHVFSQNLDQLWLLWELMIMGEPILVLGDTPTSCGDVVWGLIEIMKPIPFGGDFRPYFTIQDSDCKSILSRNKAPPAALILGVTNPVFSKALEHWPHIIKVDKMESSLYSLQVNTRYKCSMSRDKSLLKKIAEMSIKQSSFQQMDDLLQRHFVELTERFVQPLNRFYETLLTASPLQMTLSSLRSKPEIRPFRQELFYKMLEQSLPKLPVSVKKPLVELYSCFFRSIHFGSWLQYRTSDINREWRRAYLNLICSSDIQKWTFEKLSLESDAEVIDLFFRIQDELAKYSKYFIIEKESIRYISVPGFPQSHSLHTLSEDLTDNELNARPSSSSLASTRPITPVSLYTRSNPSSPSKLDLKLDIHQQESLSSPLKSAPMSSSSILSPDYIADKTQLEIFCTADLGIASAHNAPLTPNPSNVMGGLIPSVNQFSKLFQQSDLLLNSLPFDLRTNLVAKFKK